MQLTLHHNPKPRKGLAIKPAWNYIRQLKFNICSYENYFWKYFRYFISFVVNHWYPSDHIHRKICSLWRKESLWTLQTWRQMNKSLQLPFPWVWRPVCYHTQLANSRKGKLSVVKHKQKDRTETPPIIELFGKQWVGWHLPTEEQLA